MKFKSHEISAKTQANIGTELSFEVASARAQGIEILRFDISDSEKEKLAVYAEKKLRALKRCGRIQLFILASELINESTEAEYLKNKYPQICDIAGDCEFSYIIKI